MEANDPKLLSLIKANQSKFDRELALKLALYDAGMLAILQEEEIAEQFGMSLEQLQMFRKAHSVDIARFKDEVFVSKKNILLHLKERIGLAAALSYDRMNNADVEGDRIHKLLKELDDVMPTRTIENILTMIKGMGDEDQKERVAANAVQINITNNPALKKAEEDMRNLGKVIEVKEEPK